MPLLETLPPMIEEALQATRRETNGNGHRNGHDDSAEPAAGDGIPLLAVQTDLKQDATLGERWVVADRDTIRVLTPNGDDQAHLDLALPLSEVHGVHSENLVGGGALIAERGSDQIELARFTTALGGRMAGVARVLDALAKDEEPPRLEAHQEEQRCPTCGRYLRRVGDVCPACVDKRATLIRLLGYAAPYRSQAIFLVLLMFAGTAMALAPGIIIKHLTDDVLVPQQQNVSVAERYRLLAWLVGALIGTQVFNLAIQIGRGRLSAWLSATVTLKIRNQVFERLQRLSLSYYDKRQSGALLTRVTQDVNELNNFLVDGLQILVVNGLTILGITAILLVNNVRLTLLVLLPVPLVIFITRRIWHFLRRKLHKLWQTRSRLGAAINSTLIGVRVVKAFAQEDREINRFDKRVTNLYRINLDLENWWATLFPVLNLLTTSGMFIVWYIGGGQVIKSIITLGTLQMFLFLLGQLYGPLQQMTRIADWLSRAVTAAERVFEVVDADPEVQDDADAVSMPHINGEVEFSNVRFGYDTARPVIEDLNLHVQPGEMIGLVGHSGAGKSTLINLLARFYDPVEGQVKVDGVDLKKIKMSDHRRQIGMVLQEPFLFPGSISENIAYGKPDATPIEIMRAAKAANAHDFVMRFPDGYDTQVGERGVRLSGGERQRISIARAILHDPRILILDEATASVDTETEKQIQEAIQRLIHNRTTFAIAHRLSTLRNADRIVVIDNGKLAEVGTHDELMHKENGIFRRLVGMQTEINKLRDNVLSVD